MILALTIYGILFAIAAFGPIRWSLIAYLLLSTIDFHQSGENIGLLNALKGIVLPVHLLLRLRRYAGHQKIILAPIAWVLLICYAIVAGFWSFSPLSALKLAGHMTGSMLICFVFMRASKAGLVGFRMAVPLTVGALAIGAICTIFQPGWGGNESRFSSFTTAQAYASLLAALYCLVLCSPRLRLYNRLLLAALLAMALVLNGSRIWTIGILVGTMLALLVSHVRSWLKICGMGFAILLIAVLVWQQDKVIGALAEYAESNRIAAAITAAYEGDTRSAGLGTYRFRRGIETKEMDGITQSSPLELVFGHGTSNGALLVVGSRFLSKLDANRLMHNEWLRVMYEWGILGAILWLMFIGSVALYGIEGLRTDRSEYAKPLVVYFPAFMLGLAGENILAGAGSAVNVGLLLFVAFASVSHRRIRTEQPVMPELEPVAVS